VHPLERLINLVALLLETGRPLTFEQIRTSLGAYDQEDRASAKRQFERDKDLLRQIGIPVEVEATDVWDVEEGYRIPRERYELPDISFTPEEAAALFVAMRAAGTDGGASEALGKLLPGAGRAVLAASGSEAFAAVDAAGPSLRQVGEAVMERRRVRFTYRPAQGEGGERKVDAWGLVFRRGAWYLVGGDRDRGEPRSFRLSRIASEIDTVGEAEPPPPEFRAADHLMAGPWGVGEPQTTARVAFSPKVVWLVLREVPGAEEVGVRDDGWTEVEVPAAAGEAFVSWVLSFGPDAELLEPEELRAEVIRSLEEVGATR
jgi:predicted DNA-binding transcriptional regulator YafY